MSGTTLDRRRALGIALGAGAASALPARAQLARPARVVLGFPAGGSSDTVARLLADRMRGVYAPSLLVENRAGAGGRLAVEHVKAAQANGETILQTPATILTIYPHLYQQTLRYDPLVDLVPVTTVCSFAYAFTVRADHPAKTLAEFIAWSKEQGSTNWASPAAGSGPHFLGVEFARLAGITLNHVPYRGTAPALQDLLGGSITAVNVVLGEVTQLHQGGQARILAISAPTRSTRLPDVPTFAEQGFGSLTSGEWFGWFLPAGTPATVVNALHTNLRDTLANNGVREALARLDYVPEVMEPAAFAERIRRETEAWKPIVVASGYRPEQ